MLVKLALSDWDDGCNNALFKIIQDTYNKMGYLLIGDEKFFIDKINVLVPKSNIMEANISIRHLKD